MRLRYLALTHFKEGQSRDQIAGYLKVSRTSVNAWVKAFLEQGLDGLQEKPHTGRPFELTEKPRTELARDIEQNTIKQDGGWLQETDIQTYILQHFDVKAELSNP